MPWSSCFSRDDRDALIRIRAPADFPLRRLLSYYRGDVLFAIAAYNAGDGAVDREVDHEVHHFRGIPPFTETAFYVKKIYAFYKQPHHPFDASLAEASPIVANGGAIR